MPPSSSSGNRETGKYRPRPPPWRLPATRELRRAAPPDRRRVRRLRGLRLPLRILMLLAIAATLVLARSLLIPLVLAAFIALALNPIVVGLNRIYVPRVLGSLLVMLVLIGALGGVAAGVSGPATHWLQEAPVILHDAGHKLRQMVQPLTRASHAASESLAGVSGERPAQQVALTSNGFSFDDLTRQAPGIVVAVLTVALLVFFFLGYGRDVAAHLVTATPRFGYRRVALRLIRGIQQEFSHYLLTVTVINSCLGVATALVTWGLGLPTPLLWGGLAALLNFMPYVGAVSNTLLLMLAGLMTFSSPLQALAPAACFAVISALEGNVITPMVLGSRMRLSPLAILVWLLVWAWMWGIPGALLAVPMLTCAKLVTEWLPGWQWFARMVER